MSSSDGFCSTLTFAPGELGQQYTAPTSQTPLHTPTPSTTVPASTSATTVVPPASPARSNSASSNTATTPSLSQPSTTPAAGTTTAAAAAAAPAPVINNPTPTLGSVPLVTATNSAQPPALPLTTPPQTPLSAVPHSASASTSASGNGSGTGTGTGTGTVLGKREDHPRESSSAQTGAGSTEQPVKKRRVAPTLVSSASGDGNGNGS